MKKLVFMFVAMAAISFASCGNTEKAGDAADSTADSTVVADSAADSVVADSVVVADSASADSVNA